MNSTTAKKNCKALHHESNLINLNNISKLKSLFLHINNAFDGEQLSFYGRLESDLDESTTNIIINTGDGDIRISACIKKQNFIRESVQMQEKSNTSQLYCPYIEMNRDIFSKSHCFSYNNCEEQLYYICNYDKKLYGDTNANEKNQSSSYNYSDTLQDYQQDPKMSYVMNSFLAIAYALNRIHQTVI